MSLNVDALLKSYPRLRPDLPEAYRRVYVSEYKLNRDGEKAVEGLAKRLEAWMHRQVAAVQGKTVLELGAGTLNHLKFETDFGAYDAVEPFTALYQDSPNLKMIRNMYARVDDVPPQNRYKRIISVAVLEHIEDLPSALATCCKLLDDKGVFQAGIPSEGGFLWWLGWRFTTGLSYWWRNRLDYGVLMRHEHLNTAEEIIAVMRLLFKDVKVRRFPFPLHHLSFYAYIDAREPRLELAQRILDERETGPASPSGAG